MNAVCRDNAETREATAITKLDAGELGHIYDVWAAPLFRYAFAITANADDAEDAVAEVFANVARGKHPAASHRLRAYLYVAVRNTCYTLLRKRKREVSPDETVEHRQDYRPETDLEVREAVTSLPADQREVVVLKCVNGLTFEEIGKAMRISPNTAASRYRYALDKLRKELKADADG